MASIKKDTTIITTTPIKAAAKKWATELNDTGYISWEDLQAKLEEVFAPDGYQPEDFKIMTRSERWTYYAPRELTYDDHEAPLNLIQDELVRSQEWNMKLRGMVTESAWAEVG